MATERLPHLQELDRLRRVADQMATMHSVMSERLQRRSNLTLVSSLVLSLSLLLLALAEPEFVRRTLGLAPDLFRWALAAGAFANFLLVAIDLAFRPAAQAQAHDSAVRHFAKAKNHLRELETRGNGLTESDLQDAKSRFFEDRDLPRIPERQFLPLKQWHKQKVAISKALDSRPLDSLRSVRKRLREGERSD